MVSVTEYCFSFSAFVICHYKTKDGATTTARQLNATITGTCGQARDLLMKQRSWKVEVEEWRK